MPALRAGGGDTASYSAATLLVPLSAPAEGFADLYAGMTFTLDDDTTIEIGPLGEASLRDDTSFDPAVTGGGRIGWWAESASWLGIALDVSHLRPEEGDDEPFRLPVLPESVLPLVLEWLAVVRNQPPAAVFGEAAAFTLHGRPAAGAARRLPVQPLVAQSPAAARLLSFATAAAEPALADVAGAAEEAERKRGGLAERRRRLCGS